MVRKNRIVVDYSLSVLERTKASKLINDHKKEYLKPYGYLSLIQKAAVSVLGIAALFTLITLLMLSLKTAPDAAFLPEHETSVSLCWCCLVSRWPCSNSMTC